MAARNVTAKVEGRTLTLTVDLTQNFGPSSTGKTEIVATTGGFDWRSAAGFGVNLTVAKSKR